MPLEVHQVSLGPLGTNCYVVRAQGLAPEAVVVDPSGDIDELRQLLARMSTQPVAILVTHGHWDHLLGVADLAEGTGARVYMSEAERVLLESPAQFVPAEIGLRPYHPDVLLRGGETIEEAGITFDVHAVPGHSPGHLAYHSDGSLFSGDVLFAGSVGRVDLPGGDWATLLDSIRSLTELYPPATTVFSGHGAVTTLGEELAHNPFLAELRTEQAR